VIEVVVELLLQFFGEFVLQVAFEALAGIGVHAGRQLKGEDSPGVPMWLAAPGYAVLGGIVGAISLLVIPNAFVHTQVMRIGTLLVVPVFAGAAMAFIGALRAKNGQEVLRIDRFGYGYLFALAMSAVRFVYAD
jgi:hypothetical protein